LAFWSCLPSSTYVSGALRPPTAHQSVSLEDPAVCGLLPGISEGFMSRGSTSPQGTGYRHPGPSPLAETDGAHCMQVVGISQAHLKECLTHEKYMLEFCREVGFGC
jgi:hypothetical protein